MKNNHFIIEYVRGTLYLALIKYLKIMVNIAFFMALI